MLILLFSIVRNVISVTSVKCQVLRMFSKCHENFPKIWKFSENLKIFKNSENFPKIWKFSENLKIFRKSEIFPKIWKIFRKSENFSKIWKFVENLIFFRNLRSGRHSDHMSQGSQVSGIAPQLSVRSWRLWCPTDQPTDNWTYRAVRWQLKIIPENII